MEFLKKFQKKTKRKIQQSHSAEKSGSEPSGVFNIRSVAKYHKKLEGGPFEDIKTFLKKSHEAEKRGEIS